MQFVVRYWSPRLPDGHRDENGEPVPVDYSTHPPTKLGLHNALLAHHDRVEILESFGDDYLCEVYVVESGRAQILTQEMAVRLFSQLPPGEVRWTEIRDFLLPQHRRAPYPNAVASHAYHAGQLDLFEEAKAGAGRPHLDCNA